MTERTDITTEWSESPRIIEVADPSTELVIQDLHDTLRSEGKQPGEAELQNLDDPFVIDSAGKEDLGGGTLVGITSTLQNAQVAFESRLTPTSTGTVTTQDINGNTITDNVATFQTDGVTRGACVINFTDESITEVLEVLSETQLRTRTLRSGSDNQFDLNDSYKVWNVIQCNLAGGNLVAIDDVDAAISPVFPTAFTQIVRTASVSATLQEQAEIQFASYNGGVTIDETSSFSGTAYPVGTPSQPVNNQTDALAIALAVGLEQFFIKGNITADIGLDFSTLTWVGQSVGKTTITIPAAAQVDDCEFEDCTLNGTLDGIPEARRCELGTVVGAQGVFTDCSVSTSVTLASSGICEFVNCRSKVAGGGASDAPEIIVGSGCELIVRGWIGGFEASGKTGTDKASLDFLSGQFIAADDNSTGTFTVRGIGKWTNMDTYIGASTVDDELVTAQMLQELWKLQGLEDGNPMTVTPTSRKTQDNAIDLTLSGDQVTTTTVTRN